MPSLRVGVVALGAEAAHTLLAIPLLQAYLIGHFHWSPAFPGYVITVFGISKLVTQTPAGRLVDRFGTRLTGIAGLLLILFSGLLFAVVSIKLLALVIACVYGAGTALLWPAFFAFVAERFAVELRGRIATVIQFAEAAGVGLGVVLGALLVDDLGYGAGFAGYAALVVAALTAIIIARHAPAVRRVPKLGQEAGLLALLRDAVSTSISPTLAFLTVTGICLTLAPNLLIAIVQNYAARQLHVQLDQLIVPLAVAGGLGAGALVASGTASDRLGRLPMTLLGLVLAAAGFWLLGGANSVLTATLFGIPAGAGYLITQPAWSAAVFDAAHAQHRGAQFSLVMLAQGAAESLAPAAGGQLAAALGPGAPFRAAGLVLAAAVAVTTAQLLYERRHKPEVAPPRE